MSRLRSESGLPSASSKSHDKNYTGNTTASGGDDRQRLSQEESDFICSLIKQQRNVVDEHEAVHRVGFEMRLLIDN